MCELHQTREKFDKSITEVKKEVATAQEQTAKDLSHKLNRTSYQFRKKGHEMQYTFNLGVEESISSAQRELEKMAEAVQSEGKESLRKATDYLDEGASALKTRQKHIKVVDRSDFGWGAVQRYQADPLADDSDDEKQLRRADKEAKRDFEESEAYNRKTREGGWGARRGRRFNPYAYSNRHYYDTWDNPSSSGRREAPPPLPPKPLMSLAPQRQSRPKVLGPCFSCGGFGHLARTCPYKGVYGKPGMPEQPGSAGTALFLRLESHANTIMPLIEKNLQ